jgi:hypothetical protein
VLVPRHTWASQAGEQPAQDTSEVDALPGLDLLLVPQHSLVLGFTPKLSLMIANHLLHEVLIETIHTYLLSPIYTFIDQLEISLTNVSIPDDHHQSVKLTSTIRHSASINRQS